MRCRRAAPDRSHSSAPRSGGEYRAPPDPVHGVSRRSRVHPTAYAAAGRLRRHCRMPITIITRYIANSSIVRYKRRVKYRHKLTESITSHQCQFSYTLRATRKVANTLDHVTIESTNGEAAGVKRRKKYELTTDRPITPANPNKCRAIGQRHTARVPPPRPCLHCQYP